MIQRSLPRLILILTGVLLLLSGLEVSLPVPHAQQVRPPEGAAQGGSPAQKAEEQDQGAVVRISTQLIQIDAIVTDKKGTHIEDLQQSDFELLVDGKPQPLNYFKLIRLAAPAPAPANHPKDKTPPLFLRPTRQLNDDEVKRTIAIVVDDLRLGHAGIYFAQDALKRFVAEQVQDGDLVGIITTARGMGFYQQYTSDKRILYAAINKMRWFPNSRMTFQFSGASDEFLTGKNSAFETPSEKADRERASQGDPNGQKNASAENAERLQQRALNYGTIGALSYVVRSLRGLPGRKMMVALAPPIVPSINDASLNERILRLAELANRASISFYSIDPNGLVAPMPGEEYSGSNTFQDLLHDLAYNTGGLAFYNNNDTAGQLKKMADDNHSYYLLGFDPEDEKFDRKYHTIKVRVKTPGLQVRSREGFFGFPDSPAVGAPTTRGAAFRNALLSPFGTREIMYQTTSFLYHAGSGEPVIRSYFHIDCSTLQFKDEPGGKKSVTLALGNFTFNESGLVAESDLRVMKPELDEARYRQALAVGLAYVADFPIKKFGAYHVRSVVQDLATGKLGSASQFLQIPDLRRGRLALSGLTLSGSTEEQEAAFQAVQANASPDVWPIPAVRRFARSGRLEYRAVIYNPVVDKSSGLPKLSSQFEIYRGDQVLFQAPNAPVGTTGQTNFKRIELAGGLRLQGLPPGDYLLRVLVTDELAKGKNNKVEQWMDFSVK